MLQGNGTGAFTAITGNINSLARWTSANTIGSSIVTDDGTNVGIGTSTPLAKLDISTNASTNVRISSSNSNDISLEFKRLGSDWSIRNSTGLLFFGQSNDDLATVTDVLRLGGSSVTPASDATITLGSSSLRWTSVFAVNGVINTSDARDKTNVENLKYGLEELRKLRPVSFDWIDRPQEGRKIGLIAQELAEVLPEVVRTWDWNYDSDSRKKTPEKVMSNRLGVYYSDIIPVIVNGIKELDDRTINFSSAKIADLESRLTAKEVEITNQRQLIDELINRIQVLERRIK